MIVLSTICCSCASCKARKGKPSQWDDPKRARGRPDLEIRADHHLEHEEELAVRDEAIAVHVVHLEGDWRRRGGCRLVSDEWRVDDCGRATATEADEQPVASEPKRDAQRSFSSRPPLLLKAERPPTNSWKSTVPPPLRRREKVKATSCKVSSGTLPAVC